MLPCEQTCGEDNLENCSGSPAYLRSTLSKSGIFHLIGNYARGAQMKLLLAQRAPRTRRVGGKSSLLNSGFESQQSCDMGDGLIIVRTWLHVSAGLSELLLNLLQSCTVNIRKE